MNEFNFESGPKSLVASETALIDYIASLLGSKNRSVLTAKYNGMYCFVGG